MAIQIPDSANEVVQRAKTDVQREVPASNPFLANSWLGAIITGIANRVYDFYLQLREAFTQSIPDTATEEILERWAAIWGRNRLAATAATGNIVATGIVASNLPILTLFVTSDGLVYESTAGASIVTTVLNVTSLTRSGTTATVVTDAPHNLASNVPVTMAGAGEPEYNGTDLEIQVVDTITFTYQVSGSPATPASGTITATNTSTPVPVASQEFGDNTNQVLDAPLTLQSPIVGVDDTLNVDANELGGGTDQESDADLRARLLDRIQNPVAHFNVADIVSKAKEVNGVTRVFVEEITPAVGQVTIYFMRDNDDNPIPTAPEVVTVKNKILEIKPANTSDNDVIVLAPIPVVVSFVFTALSPDTPTMQSAIVANLQQFFDEQTSVGVDVDEDKYRSAITNTIDTDTGDRVQTFTLSSPVGDVTVTSGEIGVLGSVTYP